MENNKITVNGGDTTGNASASPTSNNTKVRYRFEYNTRKYEYSLHSGKRYFLRRLADLVNCLEYCITQDLKKNEFKTFTYNLNVTRLVNDTPDETFNAEEFNNTLRFVASQMVADMIQRTK